MYVGPVRHAQRRKRLSALLRGADSFPTQHNKNGGMFYVDFKTLPFLGSTDATTIARRE